MGLVKKILYIGAAAVALQSVGKCTIDTLAEVSEHYLTQEFPEHKQEIDNFYDSANDLTGIARNYFENTVEQFENDITDYMKGD